jgi:hypothetical protein
MEWMCLTIQTVSGRQLGFYGIVTLDAVYLHDNDDDADAYAADFERGRIHISQIAAIY